MVNGNIVDLDLSKIVVSVIRNRIGTSSSMVTVVEVGTCPISTEGDVDDEAEVTEGCSDIARAVGPESDGSSPRVRVRVTVLDVLRDLVPVESPDGNLCAIPKHGENATRCHVEGMAGTSFGVSEGATVVVAPRAQALSRDKISGETLAERAVRILVRGWGVGARITDTIVASVECALVGRVFVDVFDDVDLSAIWPVRAYRPKCRPDSGTVSKLPKIGDYESTVVRSLAGDADGSSVATRGNGRRVVDLQDSSTIRLNIGQVWGVFLGLVDNISVSWIGLSEEIPSVEERLALMLVLQLVLDGISGKVLVVVS